MLGGAKTDKQKRAGLSVISNYAFLSSKALKKPGYKTGLFILPRKSDLLIKKEKMSCISF